MSGKPITQQQVNLYMSYRNNHKQHVSAAKSGISQRSAVLDASIKESLLPANRNEIIALEPIHSTVLLSNT